MGESQLHPNETPYVVTYFDVEQGTPWVHLVAENIGIAPARDVTLEFDPPLKTTLKAEEMHEAFSDGISFLSPRQRITSLFDSLTNLYGGGTPSRYSVTCCFADVQGNNQWKLEYSLDLFAFRGLHYYTRKSLDDEIREISSISRELREGNRNNEGMVEALWAMVGGYGPDIPIFVRELDWVSAVIAQLRFVCLLWRAAHTPLPGLKPVCRDYRLVQTFMASAQVKIIKLIVARPSDAEDQLTAGMRDISDLCSWLAGMPFYIDGGASGKQFDDLGNDLSSRIDDLLKEARRYREALTTQGHESA